MPDEIENQNEQVVENQVEQQGEQQQEQQVETFAPKSVDAALDKFIKDSEGARPQAQKQTPVDPNAPKLGADGKPIQAAPKQQQSGQQPQQNQQVRPTTPRAGVREFGKRYYRDASSNIVDRETNKVVAKAGAPYAVASGFLPYITKLEQDLDNTNTRMKAFEDARALSKNEGLSIEEDALGTRLMVSWKKDPVGTLKFLLTQAQEQGKDVSSLTGGQSFDPTPIMKGIEERITKAMEPFMFIVNDRQQQAQQKQAEEEAVLQAETETNDFLERFPDARTQDPAIAALMTANGWSMTEAYFALKAHAAENGFNWAQPIGPQIAAKRAAPNGGGQNNRQLPNMNARGGSQQQVRVDSRHADADASMGDIIKDVLRENGIES